MTRLITISVMGKPQRVLFSGTDEEYRKFQARRRSGKIHKRRALERARLATGEAKIEAVSGYLPLLDSASRAGRLVELIEHEPAPVFWPIFTDFWTDCDEVFPWTERLTAALRRVGPCPDLAVGTSALTVYRGAARDRVDGLSWTTDRDVAAKFAAGHRGIAVIDPVIATATVSPSKVYWFTDDRREAEVICRPRQWKIQPFARADAEPV